MTKGRQTVRVISAGGHVWSGWKGSNSIAVHSVADFCLINPISPSPAVPKGE